MAQDDRGPLPRRQGEQVCPQCVVVDDRRGHVFAHRLRQVLRWALVEPAPPPPRDGGRRDHSSGVGLRVRDLAQPGPRDVRLLQGLLHQVLGQLVVAQDQVRHPEQRTGAGRDEVRELLCVPAPCC